MNRHGEVNATEATVTARLAFACHGYRCHEVIRRGEDYVRLVAFPGHDANGGTSPWVLKICVACYREHDPAAPLPQRRATGAQSDERGASGPVCQQTATEAQEAAR